METKLIVLLAAMLAMGGFTTAKLYAGDKAARGAAGGKVFRRAADKLDLTSAQRDQIRAVFASQKEVLPPLLKRLHEARNELRETIHASGASESSVRAAAAKVAVVEADLAVERQLLYGKIAPILTAEQLRTLSELEQRADELVNRVLAGLGSRLDQ